MDSASLADKGTVDSSYQGLGLRVQALGVSYK